ncbi:transcriptional regulator [Desulfosporosinus orientis DSM 765]|uniref:Transcriptional regulator n=1 Tax=Desulfosporosinus orientis (strain ATCC 19365 / DSM 765 / NCIMB 8382 / VKM B-1628 / Singapore I) TaxID=768706 RepID=G7WHR2_DESOD|nr:TetR/AcrR family transcriptional regulator [Desulfosporosinus orientis]AET69624.1 transcriptional regulator [Desulfosporosinus orientis DSM 765]
MSNENYHHENLKAELIKKGLKLLDEEGYENFSLRKVAKACGVSHTAPYRHFDSKEDLIMAIALEAHHKFNQCLEEAVEKHPNDNKSQLKEMGYAYIKFFVENPEYLRLFFLSDFANNIKKMNHEPLIDSEQPFNTFYKAIERCQADIQNGERKSVDTNALALSSWGLVHGMAILIAKKNFSYEGDYLELVRKVLWGGTFLNL